MRYDLLELNLNSQLGEMLSSGNEDNQLKFEYLLRTALIRTKEVAARLGREFFETRLAYHGTRDAKAFTIRRP